MNNEGINFKIKEPDHCDYSILWISTVMKLYQSFICVTIAKGNMHGDSILVWLGDMIKVS